MTDYSFNKFRLGGIARMDFYDVPEKTFFNYNLYATYKPSESLMFRLVAGKANRGSFILDAYYDQEMQLGPYSARLLGNQNLALTQMQTFEFGIRTPLALGLLFDLEVFRAELSDFYTNVTLTSDSLNTTSQLKNIPTKMVQNGFTAALVFLEKKTNLQMNAYLTVQKSDIEKAWTEDSEGNITYNDREHKATPRMFGGVNVFYRHKKLSLNLQTWYMSEQTMTEMSYTRQSSISAEYLTLKSYVGLNAKVSYHVTPSWTFFLNGRNLLNGGQVQTFMGDKLPTVFFAGINLKW
jgi:iron complex outermembrane receptor protein